MLLITIIFIVAGAALFVGGLHQIKLGKMSNSWKPVEATILQKGRYMSRDAQGDVKTHKFYIIYEYEVEGKQYQNDRVSFKTALIPTYKQQAKYKGVENITVYYCPDAPEQSVIEKGVDGSNYLTIIASIFFVTAGVAYYVWSN